MKIKVDGVFVSIDKIKNCQEIRTYIAIQKEREKTQKRKIINCILKNRKIVNEMLEKTDEDLVEILNELNKKRINLDRFRMFKSKIPFIIN